MLAEVRDMAERRGLAMIGAWQTGPGSYLVPEAFSVTGAEVGKLLLPEATYWLSVAPDGGWAAWVPRNSVFPRTAEPLLRFTNDPRSVRTLRFKGICGNQVAISSNAVHLALVAVVDPEGGRRLIVLDSATAEVEHDVTDLITRFRLADVYRFQISANGGRLAVASRESFVVIDLPSRKIMLDVDGRWPSLSPQGDILAFTDKSGYLIMASLATGARRAIRNRWWNIVGIGAWSPDGRFLLAGARDPIGLFTNLLAIRGLPPDASFARRLSRQSANDPHTRISTPACTDLPPSGCGTNGRQPIDHSQNPCSSAGSPSQLRSTEPARALRVSHVSLFAPADLLPNTVGRPASH